MRQRRPGSAERRAADFNRRHPVGVRVRYWSFARPFDDRDGAIGHTEGAAYVLGEHTAVVRVLKEGSCGGEMIALSHVKAEAAIEPDGIAEKRDHEAREMARDLRRDKFDRMEREGDV